MCQGVSVDISNVLPTCSDTQRLRFNRRPRSHTHNTLPPLPPFLPALGGPVVPVVHHHSPFHSMANVLDRRSTPGGCGCFATPPSLLDACWTRVCRLRTLFVNCCVGWDGRENHVTAGLTQGREKPEHITPTPNQNKKGTGQEKRRADGQTGVYIYLSIQENRNRKKKCWERDEETRNDVHKSRNRSPSDARRKNMTGRAGGSGGI
jgi:hypothetical protein